MDLAGLTDTTTKYADIEDKMYLRRVSEVLRAHLTPSLAKGAEEVKAACDEAGVWYDEEDWKVKALRRGIGMHYSELPRKYKNAVIINNQDKCAICVLDNMT